MTKSDDDDDQYDDDHDEQSKLFFPERHNWSAVGKQARKFIVSLHC